MRAEVIRGRLGDPRKLVLDRGVVVFLVRRGGGILGRADAGRDRLLRRCGVAEADRGEVLAHGSPLVGFHPGSRSCFPDFALYPRGLTVVAEH